MDFISSKNIFLLTRDTLKLFDKEIMKHGSRTGYILYQMLIERGGYEKFEMAEFVLLATLHDIGVYRTNAKDEYLNYEIKDVIPHSVFGYLFLKYLSPMEDKAKIILYHHMDYQKIKDNPYLYKDEACFLSLAEKVDIYMTALGDKFDVSILDKYKDTKYSAESMDLLRRANENSHIYEKLKSEEYEKELDELLDYIMFTNDEKRRYMEMLMYCLGFRSENKVIDSVTSICICEELAQYLYLNEDEIEKLYYGALIHDIGMLAIPSEIIDSERKLTPDEITLMRTHVEVLRKILAERLDQDVLDICVSHHERLDGSGYPLGITESEMNVSQKILQVADTVTGMISERSYKKAATKDEVIAVLEKEASMNRLSKRVVEPMVLYYDDIINKIQMEASQILSLDKKMNEQYCRVSEKYGMKKSQQ